MATKAEFVEALSDLIQRGDVIVLGPNAAGQYVVVADVWATIEEIRNSKKLWNTEREEIIADMFIGAERC